MSVLLRHPISCLSEFVHSLEVNYLVLRAVDEHDEENMPIKDMKEDVSCYRVSVTDTTVIHPNSEQLVKAKPGLRNYTQTAH